MNAEICALLNKRISEIGLKLSADDAPMITHMIKTGHVMIAVRNLKTNKVKLITSPAKSSFKHVLKIISLWKEEE